MNSFEEAIVVLLRELKNFEFPDDERPITPELCRERIETHSTFSWADKKRMDVYFSYTEAYPSNLVSAACAFAWNSVNWDLIAEAVKKEI